MKDLNTILTDFNTAIAGSYDRNQQVIDDIQFAKVPGAQWRGSDYEQFRNKPKPENNKIAKQINRILGQYMKLEMNAKIISASDEATDDDAELLQGRWRNDFNSSDGIEAIQNAADEAFHGGFGAFKVVAKYEDEEIADDNYQYLAIEPVYSAASSVVFNAGALRKDKQDAKQCWHLQRVNRQETEEEYDVNIASFPEATTDIEYFDWHCDENKDVYIAHYYEVVERTITEHDFGGLVITRDGRKLTDNFGNKIDREEFKALKANNPYEETRRKVKQVEYALMSGDQFLIKPVKTPFKSIPVIPQYGYHWVIEGVEYYCGEVCRQRDNQRFMNMAYSSMMEILAQPQVETPYFAPEQVAKYKAMHARHTVENFAYLLVDPIKDANGNPVQLGPIGSKLPPQIGTGLASAMQFLNDAIDQQGGTGQSSVPANTSEGAIVQVNDREDDSYQPLFQNAIQSIKAACRVWLPAAQKLYFSNERQLRIEGEDGAYSQVMTLQYEFRPETGQFGPFKNAARGRYDVTVKVGEAHKTMKEAEKQAAIELLQYTDTTTPKGQLVLNDAIQATTGEGTQDARRIARFDNLDIMIARGIDPQPKTDEERAYVQQKLQEIAAAAQQPPEPSPEMVLAMAEDKKGQAALISEENDRLELQLKAEEIRLKELELQIRAAQANVTIEKTMVETRGKQIDNAKSLTEAHAPQVRQ